jgi:hypothetical protein
MSSENGRWAVTAVVACLRETLAEQFQALYVLDDPAKGTPAELLIVTADAFWAPEQGELSPFHRLRHAFLPVWQRAGSHFREGPLLATMPALAQLSLLHPVFAQRLAGQARLVAGREVRPDPAGVDPLEEAAYWASESMRLSAALAPTLMEPAAAAQRLQELRWAVAQWRGQPVAGAVGGDEPAVRLLAELQERLRAALPALPPDPTVPEEPLPGAPPLLPQLRAIYERSSTLILLLPELSVAELAAVDWPKVATLFEGQYSELHVATPAQLRLALQRQDPLRYALYSYRHLWGEDPVANLEVERRRILRDAARLSSIILTHDFPQAYLTDGDVYRVIHDGNNRLLNIQLQHELLARALQLPVVRPPARLTDQAAPEWQRIPAIAAELSWWTDYYLREMVSCAP